MHSSQLDIATDDDDNENKICRSKPKVCQIKVSNFFNLQNRISNIEFKEFM